MIVIDWAAYEPYFTRAEFACRHTGKCGMQVHFMNRLLALRLDYGKPMRITSGYRHTSHPREAAKQTTGEHTMGVCCDVAVEGIDAVRLLQLALSHGFSRVGVQQKGVGRFLHLGLGGPGLPNPALWSY